MERFNHRLTDYWPCPCCFGFGYACLVCTLGLSWYFPSMCVSSAEKFAVQYFDEQANSRTEYYDIKLNFKLKKSVVAHGLKFLLYHLDQRKSIFL